MTANTTNDPIGEGEFDPADFTEEKVRKRVGWWRYSVYYPVKRRWDAVRFFVRITAPEFFIRGRRGWAPSDTWNLDSYLARVMGESLAHLADHENGWPGEDSEWPTHEEWVAELRKHAEALKAYNKDGTWEEEHQRAVAGAASIARLSTFWGHLWD